MQNAQVEDCRTDQPNAAQFTITHKMNTTKSLKITEPVNELGCGDVTEEEEEEDEDDEEVILRFLTSDEYKEFRSKHRCHDEAALKAILCDDRLDLFKKTELFNKSGIWENEEAMSEILTKSERLRTAYIKFLYDLMGKRPDQTPEEQEKFDHKRRDALDCEDDCIWDSLCFHVLDSRDQLPKEVYEALYNLGFDFVYEFLRMYRHDVSNASLGRLRRFLRETGLSGSKRHVIIKSAIRDYGMADCVLSCKRRRALGVVSK